ncbi:MAG: hypothetical protein ACOY71_11705 [Gemmatimonadota bacterium]
MLGLGLAGCVQTKATVLDMTVHTQPICPEGVKIYLSAEEVPGDAIKLALLKSSGDDDFTSASGMIESQRKKAAAVGANALVLMGQKDASTGAKVASALLRIPKNRKGEAVALYVPGDSARVRAACAGRPSR